MSLTEACLWDLWLLYFFVCSILKLFGHKNVSSVNLILYIFCAIDTHK